MKKNDVLNIINILKTYPDANALDLQLHLNLLLLLFLFSAQCTDDRVNKTTQYYLINVKQ